MVAQGRPGHGPSQRLLEGVEEGGLELPVRTVVVRQVAQVKKHIGGVAVPAGILSHGTVNHGKVRCILSRVA